MTPNQEDKLTQIICFVHIIASRDNNNIRKFIDNYTEDIQEWYNDRHTKRKEELKQTRDRCKWDMKLFIASQYICF